MCDVFKYRSTRSPMLFMLLLAFLLGYQNNVLQLALRDYAGNFYLNGILIGCSSPACMVFCILFIKLAPRKTTIIVTEAIAALVATVLFVWLPCQLEGECSSGQVALQTVLLFIYRTLAAIAYTAITILNLEYFASQIKPFTTVLMSFAPRVSFVLIPLTQ